MTEKLKSVISFFALFLFYKEILKNRKFLAIVWKIIY